VAYTKVKPSGWAFGEKLTSAQMNLLDTDHSTAIDPTTLSLSGTSGTITRICPWAPTFDDPTYWSVSPASANDGYFLTAAPTEQSCWWPLKVPHGATLTAVRIVIQPANSHSALPSIMPLFRLQSVSNGGTVVTELSPVADSAPDVATYELLHAIEITGASIAITNSAKRYTLMFTAEGSVDGASGCKVYHPYFDFTMTNLDFE
jgi:hypothetical protein